MLGRHWEISLAHIERVKWYAPHIRHVVLDICCSATLAPADPTAVHAPLASQVPGEPLRTCRPEALAGILQYVHSPAQRTGLHISPNQSSSMLFGSCV